MTSTFWVEPRLSEVVWPPNNFLQEMLSQDVRRRFGQCRTGRSAVNMNVWLYGDIKEWKSKALTTKSMTPSAPTDLHDDTYERGICCAFRANQPMGTASLMDPEAQVPTSSFKTSKNLTEQHLQRYENVKAEGIQAQHARSAVPLFVQTHFALPHGIFFPLGMWIVRPIRCLGCRRESLGPLR